MLTLKVVVHIVHREGKGPLHGHTLGVEVGFPDSVGSSEAVGRMQWLRDQLDYALVLQHGDPLVPLLSGQEGGTRIIALEGAQPNIRSIFGVLAGGLPALDMRVTEEGGPTYQWSIDPQIAPVPSRAPGVSGPSDGGHPSPDLAGG